MLKIMLGIAFGIVLAGVIAMTGRILVIGALIKAAEDFFHPITENNKLIPINPKTLQFPTEKYETTEERSNKAVMQARAETQRFDNVYKKPEECQDFKDQATRVKCANAYMRARAAFYASNK